MSFRYDRGTLRPPKRLPNGTLRADGLFTRTGVFEYLNPDGTLRREYRPPEEVFKEDSLDSLVGIPFCDGHPPEEVTAKNARQYAVGSVGENVRRDGNHVAGSIFAHDEEVVGKLEGGTRELSLGYKIREDWTPGVTPEGEPYDLIQRDIFYNHLALVTQARAGESARVRMDAAMQQPFVERKADTMTTEQLNEQKARADKAEGALQSEKSRADKAEAEVNVHRARADQAEADLKTSREKLALVEKERTDEKAAAELTEVVTRAKAACPQERFDGLTKRQVQERTLEKLGHKVEGKDDVYVAHRFDFALEAHAQTAGQLQQVAQAVGTVVSPAAQGAQERIDAAYKEQADYLKNRAKAGGQK